MKYAILLSLFILAGCADIDMIRRQDYVESHPGINNALKKDIAAGTIRIGMTEEQVAASWGTTPYMSRYQSVSGTVDRWTYGNCLYGCHMLTFCNGVLTDTYTSK